VFAVELAACARDGYGWELVGVGAVAACPVVFEAGGVEADGAGFGVELFGV
jgi:hypothetical protein